MTLPVGRLSDIVSLLRGERPNSMLRFQLEVRREDKEGLKFLHKKGGKDCVVNQCTISPDLFSSRVRRF